MVQCCGRIAANQDPYPIDPVAGAFVHRLRELGYVEGQNLVLEQRSVEGKFERLDEMATGFVSHKRDVILTGSGDFIAQVLQRVTRSVPIVFSNGTDPIGAGGEPFASRGEDHRASRLHRSRI